MLCQRKELGLTFEHVFLKAIVLDQVFNVNIVDREIWVWSSREEASSAFSMIFQGEAAKLRHTGQVTHSGVWN